LNAISPTACLLQAPHPPATELPTTDIGILQRLIELSLQLADLALRQAFQEASSQEATTPPTEQATTEQATMKPRRAGRADSRQIFLRLRRAIMETIAFKNRLIAGMMVEELHTRRKAMPRPTPEPASAPAPAPASREDPRRPHIARYFRESINLNERKRKIPITLQEVDTRIESELAKDPDYRLQGRSILLKVCKSLNLPFYPNRMSPELFRPAPPAPA
jgi:hypothetical protein